MLRLITGRAGTGKTGTILREIKKNVDEGRGNTVLIVPEQYSHEAERELCRLCGDSLSRYAEVFSFTGLARRISSQLGGGCTPTLDKGGRLLCMALALNAVGPRLRVYSAAARKAELQSMLLSAVDELKTSCIGSEALLTAAAQLGGGLGDKLHDLALIAESYDAIVSNGHADPTDRLTVLARQIPCTDLDRAHIYVDGFTDFTAQEREILTALLKKGAELTVCLTLDGLDSENEIFALSRLSALNLLAAAKELGVDIKIEGLSDTVGKAPALSYYADHLFDWSSRSYEGPADGISLFCAGSVGEECELAAAKAIELVRDHGCRWRDVAVAVRGFESYRDALENAFRHYGVPLFVSKKSDLLSRPLPAMISFAYEILSGGWDVDDVLSYMGTGLTGLSADECDTLGNYIFKWQLRGSAWHREDDWHQHPNGYGEKYDSETEEKLTGINALRRRLADPLLHFASHAGEAETASQQAAALAGFFAELRLPEQLQKRAGELSAAGKEASAQETAQLWGIVVSALEQSEAVLGETPMSMAEFGKLFALMLSKYDVGTIPVSLDRVSAGDFDRMRRRSIRHLIVLGASDERIPGASAESGMFSDDERKRLWEADIDLGGTGDSELWREFSLLYNCLTLPSESLTLCCPELDAEGTAQRPAFVMNRAKTLFGLDIRPFDSADARLSALSPAMTLAAGAVTGGNALECAAADYFKERQPGRWASLAAASSLRRGRLSPQAVEALYGKELKLSASRADQFASCKFSYFCQYGLKAKPYEPAGFTPPEIGTFMHYILENTAKEVKNLGGFRMVPDDELAAICDKYVAIYIKNELNDFREKSARFVYLFHRICDDVRQVVGDMAVELRSSDFEPLSFELDFANASVMPPVEFGSGEGSLTLTGIADRVDGWMHDGKLYLRVADYKTGKKKFSLSDIRYGMGMQMLIYLFALTENAEALYGAKAAPAGVMYVPARNTLLSSSRDLEDEDAESRRRDELRRSGIVLDDAELMEAWENGEDKRYIPVKLSGRGTDALANAEQMGLLSQHIKDSLAEMAGQLRRGNIAADPFYRSQQENACLNCKYFDACHFANGQNGESCRMTPKLKADEVWEYMRERRQNNG